MISVTQPFLPPLDEYTGYLTRIWEQRQLTNHGPLVRELEAALSQFMGGPHVQLVSNGTVALQLAIRALGLTGEVITTPFSYVATTTAILWEKCEPIFVDIEPRTFCLDADKIEAAITPRTQAILATHVYGYPCDVVRIEEIARRHQLKVIYDGAHAFGTRVGGRALLTHGDLTACSFHATKLFHTGEGGALVTWQPELAATIGLLKTNGHVGDDHQLVGTNAKTSELNAALGLCLLPRVPGFVQERAQLYRTYRDELEGLPLRYPEPAPDVEYNYAYFPVVFDSELQMLSIKEQLAAEGIGTRRYFFPTLNSLPYHAGAACPVAEDISRRVLCLPLHQELTLAQVQWISQLIRVGLHGETYTAISRCANE